jgi:tetratricopeptide (TPR) repeat protein
MEKDQAAEHAILAARRAELDASKAARRAERDDVVATMAEARELDDASNGVVDLIHAGRLDEAEQAARDLLVRYPEVPDGHDRLGMVYEARGQKAQAADCYRRVIGFMRAHPEGFEPQSEANFLERIASLEPAPPADGSPR